MAQIKKPLIVNFYAGPGCGKTTAALELSAALKKKGYNIEYVPEYAKELVLEGKLTELKKQENVTNEQYHRLDRLRNVTDIVVTDSPVLLGLIYGEGKISEEYKNQIIRYYNSFDNFNMLMVRDRTSGYQTEGRLETEKEAIAIDEKIKDMLKSYNIFYGTYKRDDIAKTVERIERTYNRLYSARQEDTKKMTELDWESLEGQFTVIQSAEGLCLLCSDENEKYLVADELMDITLPDSENKVFLSNDKFEELKKVADGGRNVFIDYYEEGAAELKASVEKRKTNETEEDRQYRAYLYSLREQVYDDEWLSYAQDKSTFLATKKESSEEGIPPKPNYVNDRAYEKSTPFCLRTRSQFVGWKYEYNEDRKSWTKVPYNPRNGQKASSVNPYSWSNFETACAAVDKYGFDGLGIMFGKGLIGIDIDHVIDENGKISERAKEVIDSVNSYTEYSPSGSGVHILAFGTFPGTYTRKDEFEMYSKSRFFTLTGKPFEGQFRKIPKASESQEAINAMYEKYIVAGRTATIDRSAIMNSSEREELTDEEIIQKCRESKNGAEFERLWRGDTSMYTHRDGTPDRSQSDLALVGKFAYYSSSVAQIDRLFRRSGLMRPKWDSLRGGVPYGIGTINFALRSRGTTHYNPDSLDGQQRVSQAPDWLSIDIPKSSYVKDYAKGKLLKITKGDFIGATFFYPSTLIRENENGYALKVKKDFIFTLNRKGGESLEVNPIEMRAIIDGKSINRQMQRKSEQQKSQSQNTNNDQFD